MPPHGFSQTVSWDGEAVVKEFGHRSAHRATVERTMLARLASTLPVPELLPGSDGRRVRMAFVPGVLGQEWVAAGRPATDPARIARHVTFLTHCGRTLRALHAVDPDLDPDPDVEPPGDGPVFVHGDFAPYNVIVGSEHGELRAVIDWELAHRGDPLEDLAWMEWHLRIWYSPQPGVLESFYRAYGALPAWPDRHAAMLERCDLHVQRALRPSYPSAESRVRWLEHQERTRGFDEVVAID